MQEKVQKVEQKAMLKTGLRQKIGQQTELKVKPKKAENNA